MDLMALPTVKHKFTSAKADGPDSTEVKPTDWNADHDILVSQANRYLGRDSSGAGDAQELIVVPSGPGDNGTIWTAAMVQAAIATAIANIPPPVTVPVGATVGWYSNTLPAGNWLFCNGLTVGNTLSGASWLGATYQALFTFLWTAMSNAALPIYTSGGVLSTRGASAASDWAAQKRMSLPDECGRVSAGADNMGGITSKNRLTVGGGGLDGDIMGAAAGVEISKHKHEGTTEQAFGTWGIVGSGPATGTHTHKFETDEKTLPTLQPTIIKNVIIKY